jgi:hypothetical protein
LYATVVYCPLAVKINLPRKRGNRPLTEKAMKTDDCAEGNTQNQAGEPRALQCAGVTIVVHIAI